MKKITQTTLLFVLIAFQAMAQSTETRTLSSFDAVRSSGSIDVILKKGNSEKAEVSAKGTDISNVITEVSGNTLVVRMKQGNYRSIDIEVTVYFKEINEFSASGSGNTEAKSVIKSDELAIKLSGSGDFKGKVDANDLTLKLSGSGEINVSGNSDNQEVMINGSGNVRAKEVESQNVEVKINGSGTADVWATERIEAKVNGSGNVRYKGNPNKVISKSTGSGTIRKI